MREPQHLTTLWASTVCYRATFTFFTLRNDGFALLHGKFLVCGPAPRLCASRRPVRPLLRGACEFCLTTDNVRNEVVTVHRSHEV
jgi:hypothetical protein